MAESSKVDKDDNLEDSLSSEDWMIIYKKEANYNCISEKKNKKIFNDSNETVDIEDDCNTKQNCDCRVEDIEVGVEVGEKEEESDDVSVISDESESEQFIDEGKVDRIDWQIESKQSNQLTTLSSNHISDGSITSSALIICSMVALILGIIFASQIVEFHAEEPSHSVHNEIQAKLRELIGIKEKLKDLNDVKLALDQIRVNVPKMKKLKDKLIYKNYKKNKAKYLGENYKNFEKLNAENVLNLNGYDNTLELLEITYQNFCSIITKINSTNSSTFENKLCKTPKILSDMIIFKQNLKQVFEINLETDLPEKRFFLDVEKKLDLVSESLLFEFNAAFSKFTKKIQERLNKLGYEMHFRLCYLYSKDQINNKFFKITLNKTHFLSYCNESNSDPIIINLRSNVTKKDRKGYGAKRKSDIEIKKNEYKHNDKNIKNHKKTYDSKKNASYEKIYPEQNFIKGEVKADNNWKKNKNENKEKYSQEQKKYNYEKSDNYKNNFNKKSKLIHNINNSFETKRGSEFDIYNKLEHDYDCKFEKNKERECKKKLYEKTNQEFEYKFEFNKKNYETDHKKDDSKKIFQHNNYDFGEDDSNFIVNLENYLNKYPDNKKYIINPDNFKEIKYIKFEGDKHWDKRDKYQPNGDWQMQRSKAREKHRNSDWYFVRADSRQKARIVEENNEHTWNSPSFRNK